MNSSASSVGVEWWSSMFCVDMVRERAGHCVICPRGWRNFVLRVSLFAVSRSRVTDCGSRERDRGSRIADRDKRGVR
eukprot:scaffold10444_cov71-Cyclotella_meneghiniana.AAC.6